MTSPYYLGHESVTRAANGRGLPSWQVASYAWMLRNAAHVSDLLHLQSDSVVEIGRQIEI